jgi:hypothetical protein
LNAVWFVDGVGFFIGCWVARRFCPVVQGHGTNVNADAVSSAYVPVYGNVASMNAQFLRWFNGPPDFVPIVFSYNFSVLLKIRVYWQKLSPLLVLGKREILGFLLQCTIKIGCATL